MATDNPTGRGPGITVAIPTKNRRFLRGLFEIARGGIRDDLADHPEAIREPARLQREEGAYDALLAALDGGSIVASADVCSVLGDLAQMIDRENEYRRVIAEHAALLGLREQVCEGAGR
jgi:hypothetical protein